MSANVWYEEVERGLIQEILNTVMYVNDSGEKVPIDRKRVFIRDPEEDLTDEVFPCVTITPIMDYFDSKRYNPNPQVVDRDVEHNTVVMQDSAIPFNLVYQIDFWSRYREDINVMTSSWIKSHFRQFNLEVVDDGGTKRTSNVLLYEPMKSSNFVLNKKRLFRSLISYTIWVELDDEVRYNDYMVKDVDMSTTNQE